MLWSVRANRLSVGAHRAYAMGIFRGGLCPPKTQCVPSLCELTQHLSGPRRVCPCTRVELMGEFMVYMRVLCMWLACIQLASNLK